MDTKTTLKNKYQADVAVLAAGTELVGYPCVVFDITVAADEAGDCNISFSNSTSSYSNSTRLLKVITTDENHTVHLSFPKGKVFSSGLCAKANKGSVDVSVTFE